MKNTFPYTGTVNIVHQTLRNGQCSILILCYTLAGNTRLRITGLLLRECATPCLGTSTCTATMYSMVTYWYIIFPEGKLCYLFHYCRKGVVVSPSNDVYLKLYVVVTFIRVSTFLTSGNTGITTYSPHILHVCPCVHI